MQCGNVKQGPKKPRKKALFDAENTHQVVACLPGEHREFLHLMVSCKSAGRKVKDNGSQVGTHFLSMMASNYTKCGILCHQFLLSCLILLANPGVESPTLHVNPTLFVIPCKRFRGLQSYNVASIVTHEVVFHPNFNDP